MPGFCLFQAGTNTNPGLCRQTYAQNSCPARANVQMPVSPRYETHSACKSLIHKASLNCFISGQFEKTVDLQGLARVLAKLSTKLSTENRENLKPLSNQALRARFEKALKDFQRPAISQQRGRDLFQALNGPPGHGENHGPISRYGAAFSHGIRRPGKALSTRFFPVEKSAPAGTTQQPWPAK